MLRQPEYDDDGFISTDNETVFMNRIVYKRTEEDTLSRIQLFVSKPRFDRNISVIVKGAEDAKSVTFPGTVRDAHTRAFENNAQLRSVVLNKGLERLEGCGCDDGQHGEIFIGTSMKGIIFPSTLRVLGDRIFQGCKMLKCVTFREGSRLDKIGVECFSNSGIEEITIPSSVITIHEQAFSGCRALRKASFQEGSKLERMGAMCFSECGFAKITIPMTVRSIGTDAFKKCKNL